MKIKMSVCFVVFFLFVFTNCLMAQWNYTSPYEVYVDSDTRTPPTNPAFPADYSGYSWALLGISEIGADTSTANNSFYGVQGDCISVDFPQGDYIYEYTGGFFQAGSDPFNVDENDSIGMYLGSQSLARIYANDKDFENEIIVGSQSKATFEKPGRKGLADLLIGTVGHIGTFGGAVLEVSPDVKYDGEMQDNILDEVFGVQANVGLASHYCSEEDENTHIGVNAGNVYGGVFNVGSSFIAETTTLDEIEIDNLYGIKIKFDDGSTSGVLSNDTITSVTNAFGLYVEDPGDTFNGTLTNPSVGIYSEGDIVTEKDLYVGDGTDSDDYVYFDQGAESIKWDNTNSLFEVSDDLKAIGNITANSNLYVGNGLHVGSTTGDPSDDNLLVDGTITGGTNLYVGNSSPSDDDFVYYDQGNESIKWDNTNTRFDVSDDLKVTGGDIIIDDNKNIMLNPPTNSAYIRHTNANADGITLTVNNNVFAGFFNSFMGFPSGGTIFFQKAVYINEGLHVGNNNTTDPGADNLLVDGNATVSGDVTGNQKIISGNTSNVKKVQLSPSTFTGSSFTFNEDDNYWSLASASADVLIMPIPRELGGSIIKKIYMRGTTSNSSTVAWQMYRRKYDSTTNDTTNLPLKSMYLTTWTITGTNLDWTAGTEVTIDEDYQYWIKFFAVSGSNFNVYNVVLEVYNRTY